MEKEIILALLGPLLITTGALITWFLKSQREDKILIQEKTRESKIQIYQTLLEPIIITFTATATPEEKELGNKKLLSVEYKKTAFNLVTFGSDEVVRSYNKMMQALYNVNLNEIEEDDASYSIVMLTYLSDFLLSIRKDLYTNKTKLKRSEMLEFFLSDIDNYSNAINSLNTDQKLYRIFTKVN